LLICWGFQRNGNGNIFEADFNVIEASHPALLDR
jgi:hypothetical protein